MNRKIVMASSAINSIAVIGFAISMLCGFDFGSYFSSMFIAFSFVTMMCGYAFYADEKRKIAGYVSVVFSVIYATIILLVYFLPYRYSVCCAFFMFRSEMQCLNV